MKQEEFDFIKNAFSQILDDIAGNPDWNDAASAISADLGALERELEGKIVSPDKSLEDAAEGLFVGNYVAHDGRIELEGDPLPSLDPILLLPYPQFKPGDKVKVIVLKAEGGIKDD